jgi:hypothetical protein
MGGTYEAFQASKIGRRQLAVTPKSLAARRAALFRGTPSGSNPIMKLADMIAGRADPMISLLNRY